MTRKIRRRSKSRGVDLEAQPQDEGLLCNLPCIVTALNLRYKEVRGIGAYELDTHTSRRDSEAIEAFQSNATEREKDRVVHARSSESQVEGQNDSPSNSGKYSALSQY